MNTVVIRHESLLASSSIESTGVRPLMRSEKTPLPDPGTRNVVTCSQHELILPLGLREMFPLQSCGSWSSCRCRQIILVYSCGTSTPDAAECVRVSSRTSLIAHFFWHVRSTFTAPKMSIFDEGLLSLRICRFPNFASS